MEFDFHILESDSAITFFRNMGVPVEDQHDHIKLLQAIYGYIGSMAGKPDEARERAIDVAEKAFKQVTGEELKDVADKYDNTVAFDEDATDMMPREIYHADRYKQLNMKSADELMQTTMEGLLGKVGKLGKYLAKDIFKVAKTNKQISGGLVKSLGGTHAAKKTADEISPLAGAAIVGGGGAIGYGAGALGYALGTPDKKAKQSTKPEFTPESADVYITQHDLIPLDNGIQDDIGKYAQDMNLDDASGLFGLDRTGNVEYFGDEQECDDYTLDETWFADATQDFVDRVSAGECWKQVIYDLSQRFAGFFDGSYHAFDFAAAAFSRRAMDMGMIEEQMMIESFNTNGSFNKLSPISASIRYRNKTISLRSQDHDNIKLLLISRY